MLKTTTGSANIDPYSEIVKLLENHGVSYQVISHEPVFTSKQAEDVSGLSLSQGAKTILLSSKSIFILAVLPGNRKLDTKRIARHLGLGKIRFASESEVEQVMHCKVGACYPFGSFINIRVIVDPALAQEKEIAFNPGKNDQSIIMDSCDYLRVAMPEMLSITKEA